VYPPPSPSICFFILRAGLAATKSRAASVCHQISHKSTIDFRLTQYHWPIQPAVDLQDGYPKSSLLGERVIKLTLCRERFNCEECLSLFCHEVPSFSDTFDLVQKRRMTSPQTVFKTDTLSHMLVKNRDATDLRSATKASLHRQEAEKHGRHDAKTYPCPVQSCPRARLPKEEKQRSAYQYSW
jgi:hypothetical protein